MCTGRNGERLSPQTKFEAETMKKPPKKKKRENPFLSPAEEEERKEFERKTKLYRILLFAGIPVGLILLYLIFEFGTRLQE